MNTRGSKTVKFLLFFSCLLIVGIRVQAHPMPNSLLTMQIKDDHITAQVKMPLIELISAVKTDDISASNIEEFLPYFLSHIHASTSGRPWIIKMDTVLIAMDEIPMVGQYEEVVLNFSLYPSQLSDLRAFDLNYDAIVHQVVTHQVMVLVNEDWNEGQLASDVPVEVGIIKLDVSSGKIYPLHVELEQGSTWMGFKSMFVLGVNHIKDGLDHILFLLSLLLISPLLSQGGKWSLFQGTKYTLNRFLKISLMFTIGHSLSLIAGSFNVIPFNVGYIEVLIALTIILSAAHAVRPIFQSKETWIGFGFGIIHGLAFSESISGLDLSTANKAISILGFNMGIETMQLGIMLMVFPLLLLSKFRFYNFIRIGFAVVTLVLSLIWLNERISLLA